MKKIVLLSFSLSGMAALIYEVVWARQLTLIFGTTLYAISTVLAVFMAGLALGSFILGRVADRSKNPLRLYAFLQGGIGIYVFFTPPIFKLINSLQIYFARNYALDFSGFSLIRFGLCFLALILPATLMGGTLPVIVRFFVRQKKELGGNIGRLYSLNTLGGVFGSFLAGFALILLLGMKGTIYLAAIINLLIATVILLLSQKMVLEPAKTAANQSVSSYEKETPTREKRKIACLVLVLFGCSGFAALSLETSWSRVLAMIIGSSAYAFSIILTTFLLGIALGSWVISKFIDRLKNLLLWFIAIEIALGLSVILLTPLFGYLPYLFLKVFKIANGSFWSMQFMEFLLVALVMILPTTLMGAAFPIVSKICSPELKRVGRSIGNVYFSNTLGAIFGPLATGFLFIPLFGLQRSIFIAAFIYLASAGILLIFSPLKRRPVKIYTLSFLTILFALSFFIPDWNKKVLNSGVYVYARQYLQRNLNLSDSPYERLFYKEGLSATVAVKKIKEGHLTLSINGKTDAGTDLDVDTELILGHLPLLLHPNPEKVLIIGLGSGITLGAVEQYEELKKVDVIEIEPAVVKAASYFTEYNHNALEDPRLNLVVADGRNYVLMTNEKYDVITAESSNPWMVGNANLFAKEQFELYKERLKPGGIMFQWAHIYKLSPDDVKMILATFREVFPHTVLWQSFLGRDIFMIGSQEPLKIDFAAWQEKMGRENIRKDLSRVYLDDPFMLLSYSVLDEKGVRAFSQGGKIHSDNHPTLEFQAPKAIFLEPEMAECANLEGLEKYRTDIFTLLKEIDDLTTREKIALYALSRAYVMKGEISFSRGEPAEKGIAEYEKALSITPHNIRAKKHLAKVFFNGGEIHFARNLYQEAEELYRQAITQDPQMRHYYQALARAYIQQGNYEGAIGVYEQALAVEPDDLDFRLKLGVLYAVTGSLEKAEQEFLFILHQDKNNYLAHNDLANVYRLKGMNKEAIAEYKKSLEIKADQGEIEKLITLK